VVIKSTILSLLLVMVVKVELTIIFFRIHGDPCGVNMGISKFREIVVRKVVYVEYWNKLLIQLLFLPSIDFS